MSTRTVGNGTEAVVRRALVRRGLGVLLPFGDGHPYDLAADLGEGRFLRVQCKTARPAGGCFVFNARTTDHGRGPQSYRGLADVFGVYFPVEDAVYLVPIESVAEFEGRLRVRPTLNNQRRRVRRAAEFEIETWTDEGLRRLVAGREDEIVPALDFA